jgi:hypothetical protein
MMDEKQRLEAAYSDRGVPTGWEEITPPTFRRSFRLLYRAYQSPGEDDGRTAAGDEAEKFIHDPVQALIDDGLIPDEGIDKEGRRRLPRISTMVVNHEKTLRRFIMHAFVAVSKNPHTIGITIIKEEEPEPPAEHAPEPPPEPPLD